MKERHIYILLVIAMFLWGLSWPVSKILTAYAPPSVITFWRFFFVCLGSLVMLRFLNISLKIPWQTFKWIFLAGILNGLYMLMFFMALSYGEAGKGSVIVTTMIPMFSYVFFMLAVVLKKGDKLSKRVRRSEVLGLILGLFSGLCLLNIGSPNEIFSKFNTLFLLCALAWSSITLFTHKAKGAHPLTINLYINFVSTLMFSWVLFLDDPFAALQSDVKFWINMFVLVCLSTIVGTSIYYYGIHRLGSVRANSFILITPISALICSFLLLNEVPSLLTLLGCALALFAIYFINIYGKAQFNK